MKVFYLTSSVYADNQVNLIHHFDKSRYQVTYGVIFPNKNANYSESEIADYCLQHDLEFKPFPLKYRFRDPRNLVRFFEIIMVVKRSGADVVFVTNFDQLYLNMMLLMLDRRITIIGVHDVENHSNTAFSRLASIAKSVLLNSFANFLTYSRHQANLLKTRYPGKHVYMISLPLIGFGPLPRVAERRCDVTTFLFFGNILYYKGLDILLRSVGRLSERDGGFKLVIAGRCSEWEEVYAPLTQNLNCVETHIGFIDNADIPKYFADADYLVLPYRDTTQSGPLMIAYNYNVPVIASNADGFKEFFVDGETGYSFDLQTQEHLDQVLSKAINCSVAERADMKRRLAEHTFSNFSVQMLSAAYGQMFDKVSGTERTSDDLVRKGHTISH